ncbi:MAG TPA: glutamine amidotransferase, partial [Polyangiaceae bacterium]|nr:glutamine amidotransferase [Polyangiaceae bacterium]
DDVVASQDELALIPFPVDELFTKHLPSFDAVILQDFDAQPYGLSAHLGKLAAYVRQGGGLIMVGGPNAFVQGNYARTALAGVLPVSLDGIDAEEAVDFAGFVPRLTKQGTHAPVLEPLHALLGDRLPEMPGTNIVGDPREDATVLLEHPSLKTKSGAPMPVLALGEYGSGRSIALTVDGSHELLFSRFALEAAGRAHGAFWDAMLGWLMRDPRFEPAKVELPSGCVAGVESSIQLRAAFVEEGTRASVEIQRMGDGKVVHKADVTLRGGGEPVTIDIGKLEAGGYTATVRLQRQGKSAPSRYDFACEAGGEEWADARPDADRLARIAKETGGLSVPPDRIDEIPRPEAAQVVSERRVHPIMPAWAWCLIAAGFCGGHWIVRRRVGLT